MQEVALLAERSDVTEELVRLDSHLQALAAVLRGREPAGKKLDFLLQDSTKEASSAKPKVESQKKRPVSDFSLLAFLAVAILGAMRRSG